MQATAGIDQLAALSRQLPGWERERLLRQARRYLSRVDARIAHLPVRIGQGGEGYIVSDDLTEMYGTGPTVEAAQTDYRAALLDAYESLIASGPLSAALEQRLAVLRGIFEPEREAA